MDIKDFKDIPTFTGPAVEARTMEIRSAINLAPEYGSKLEFGVYKGVSINFMAKQFPEYEFTGFDTFEGVDEVWDYAPGFPRKMDVRFKDGGVEDFPSNVVLVVGKFQDTLTKWIDFVKPVSMSFLNIDSDTYSSAIYILNTLNDYILPGTIIRFDELCDWGYVGFNDKRIRNPYVNWENNEWRALLEWVKEKDREVLPILRTDFCSATIKIIK